MSNTSSTEGLADKPMIEEAGKVIEALRRQLETHNESRKGVQEKLRMICEEWRKEIDDLEDKANGKFEKRFAKESDRLGNVLGNSESLGRAETIRKLEECEESRRASQERVRATREKQIRDLDELEKGVNGELEGMFVAEDSRLQASLSGLRKAISKNKTAEALQKAKAELIVVQKYDLKVVGPEKERSFKGEDFSKHLSLAADRKVCFEWLDTDKPTSFCVKSISSGRIFLSFSFLNSEQERVLVENGLEEAIVYKVLLQKKGCKDIGMKQRLKKEKGNVGSNDGGGSLFSFVPDFIEAETVYTVKVRVKIQDEKSEWSNEAEFAAQNFSECCVWKECPDCVDEDKKYYLDPINLKTVAKVSRNDGYGRCAIIGNTTLPPNKVISWCIKILKSKFNDGSGISVGVAPSDIDQNEECNYSKCGWYLGCYNLMLHSGPPHNYRGKEYGPRKEKGKGRYVQAGDSIGVLMDTTKGELSFVVNGVNLGVAFDGIPLGKPLVPCVLMFLENDTVELDTSEVKKNS